MEIDHIFIMSDVGAPEAVALSRLGLTEGSSNTHAGQGTANRRFFSHDFYLELLWVRDREEAHGEPVRRTRLGERWSMRQSGACPFGVVLRGGERGAVRAPFPTWDYVPQYLPEGLAIGVALDVPLTEPAFFYLGFQRQRTQQGHEPLVHGVSTKVLTGVAISTPLPGPISEAARLTQASGLISFDQSSEYVLRLTFDHAIRGRTADLRPELPLMLDW